MAKKSIIIESFLFMKILERIQGPKNIHLVFHFSQPFIDREKGKRNPNYQRKVVFQLLIGRRWCCDQHIAGATALSGPNIHFPPP